MSKLLLSEMINLDKNAMLNYMDVGDQEFLWRHYNLYYLVKQQPQVKELCEVIKLFNLDTQQQQFTICYKKYSLHLRIAILVADLPKVVLLLCIQDPRLEAVLQSAAAHHSVLDGDEGMLQNRTACLHQCLPPQGGLQLLGV